MRTTVVLDDDLVKKASRLTGIRKTADLVKAGLEELITRASSRRIAELGGSEPKLKAPRRRRL